MKNSLRIGPVSQDGTRKEGLAKPLSEDLTKHRDADQCIDVLDLGNIPPMMSSIDSAASLVFTV